jgi:hypothetical protein
VRCERRQHRILDLLAAERPFEERHDEAIDAQRWWCPRHEQQIAG